MLPDSLAHRLLTSHTPVFDVWLAAKKNNMTTATLNSRRRGRRFRPPESRRPRHDMRRRAQHLALAQDAPQTARSRRL
ncbi:MAG: hypothetical protein M1826_001125 [Phylliscum demangeonii]|nr:MAG: hypothetical protein M1826_001125 [Phylliscum demangeonii]